MYRNNKLAKSVRLALMFGASATAFAGAAVAQEQDDEQAERVERIQVTGSRLNRSAMEGATPVTVISREDIDSTGFSSVADVLRSSSFNVSGSMRESSGNTAQGQATLNLRGLGSNRTLVLLNGRRMPGSPVLDGQTQNLNAIPFAAVERIEVLSDGASAVYGSDAIGGVVNIILREGYEGVEVTVSKNISDLEGGDENSISVVGGASGDRGSFTFALEKNKRDIIFSRHRDYLDSWDRNTSDTLVNGRPDFNETYGYSAAARTIVRGNQWDPSVRGDYVAMVDQDCSIYGDNHVEGVFGDGYYPADTLCAYEHTASSSQTASLDNYNIFLDGTYEISNNHRFVARALHSRTHSFGRYAPAAGGFTWTGDVLEEELLADGNTLAEIRPGDNIQYRFDITGPGRDTDQYDYVTDISLGFEGYLGTTLDLDYSISYNRNLYEMHEWGDGYVNSQGLAQAAANGWDPRQPDQSQFEGFVAGMRENANRRASMITDRIDLGVQGAGPGDSAFFIGAEIRQEEYRDQVQAQAEAGMILGTAGGTSYGERDVWAVFGEISVPVGYNIDVDLALRYDDYSDFGNNTSYKLAGRWQPIDDLVVRASYGTGFRAPSLSMLNQQPSQSYAFGRDIAACMGGTYAEVGSDPDFATNIDACLARPTTQNQTYFANNPNLQAETSSQFSMGAVYDARQALGTNLSLSLDYYWTEIEDTIQSIGVQDLLWVHFMGTIDEFEGLSYSDNAAVTPHQAQPTNFLSFDTSGLDFNVNWFDDVGPGVLSSDINLSYVLEYNTRFTPGSALQDYTDVTMNQYRLNLSLGYTLGNHNVSLFSYFIPSRCEGSTMNPDSIADATFTAQCTTDADGNKHEIGSFFHHSIQYSYNTAWDGRITVGINNLTDNHPPLSRAGTFNEDLYPIVGRQFLVRYSQRF